MVVIRLGLALMLMVACVQTQSTPSVEQTALDSWLVFEPEHIDMGSVKEGDEAVVFLRVRNAGDVMANIVKVETSCGCSVAEPEQRLLMPGGFTRIKVVVDTFAKQGEAKKWVQLTDDLGNTSKAWLKLQVQANPHLNTDDRGIFKGKCAACHFDTAKGKVKGPALYGAVCSMCHGVKAEGVSGPSLRHHNDVAVLAELIANGTGTHHMPGFAIDQGGPLNNIQIKVLSEWLFKLDETGQNR
ncbi:MAG: DUF1573 domain-containing protein [Mariprofundus sp.]|nr:DUF1573 domain-containing protein [Mariprofundus sp.]